MIKENQKNLNTKFWIVLTSVEKAEKEIAQSSFTNLAMH